MANIPTTSTTLLRQISSDPRHARWAEFVARYEPALSDFARRRFPSLETEDLVQETLLVLIKRIGAYRYDPEEKGAFHNYLFGILRYLAVDRLRRQDRERTGLADYAADPTVGANEFVDEELASWRQAAYEIARAAYFADPRVKSETKEIFRRVALYGEDPQQVATLFGISRNAVDQIKDRSLKRIRAHVEELEENPCLKS